MDKQTVRYILIAIVLFTGFSLFSKFQELQQDKTNSKITDDYSKHETIIDGAGKEKRGRDQKDIPGMVVPEVIKKHSPSVPGRELVIVETDVLKVKINSHGDLVFAELKKYPQSTKDHTKGVVLLEDDDNKFYIAQTGLLSESGPDSKTHGRAKFAAKQHLYELDSQKQELVVDLFYDYDSSGRGFDKNVNFIKRFKFNKNSYLVEVEYIIQNNSKEEYKASLYGRLRRLPEKVSSGFFSGGLRTYNGAAISTPNEKYKKISFSNMKDPYKIAFTGGWIAMLEHYFVSAWIPKANSFSEYQTEDFRDGSLGMRFVNAAVSVQPGATEKVSAQLFIGPKVADVLKKISPSLELTVDYGVLWWVCVPLFWLLRAIFNIIGNWGWAIIFTTLLIKILFYRLSAASYRSMGNLRKLQPKIEELKARCGEDRQRFSQSVMELYRKEKVNPLGGCLPILVQIPVFISLYYVLLESVELRQAPWCLWIMDLSAKDPFYVLPVVMGISMFFQQKMNPPPPDPIQAKVLMFMPIFFTALFLQFPSGLMVYWVVNNTLSILQQMYITRKVCGK